MFHFLVMFHLLFFSPSLASNTAPADALPGCSGKCGNVSIPYPFGTSSGCYQSRGFYVSCNTTYNPPRLLLSTTDIEVAEISQDSVTVYTPMARDCFSGLGLGPNINSISTDVTGLPYTFSSSRNMFTALGCDTVALNYQSSFSFSSGCVSFCSDKSSIVNGSCAGIGCCQTSIPKGLKSIYTILRSLKNHSTTWTFSPCSYAFLVDRETFVFNLTDLDDFYTKNNGVTRLRIAADTAGALAYLHSATARPIFHRDVKSANILLDENYMAKVSDFGASRLIPMDRMQITTLVQGTLGYLDPEYFQTGQLTEKSDVYSFGVVLAELLTGLLPISQDRRQEEQNLAIYFLVHMREDRLFEILEPRVRNEGSREQLLTVAELTRRCLRLRGTERPTTTEVATELERTRRRREHPWLENEHGESQSLLREPATVLLASAMVAQSLIALLFLLCLAQATSPISTALPGCRTTCGNLTLPYPFGMEEGCYIPGFKMTCNDTFYDPPKLFMGSGNIEITQVTLDNVFMEGLIARDCYGELPTSTHVWTNIENTPYTLSYARNRFTAIGCDTLALLYRATLVDFTSGCISLCADDDSVANGTCAGSGCCQTTIPMGMKRIAAETAGVLAYLHSATARPIIHRDIKSTNILLDHNYTAKVSDFGASRLVPLGRAHLTTLVQGTLGYLDPEYFHAGVLTEKSDVYSFGVVLAELLTGKPAVSSQMSREEQLLAMHFISSMERGQLFEILERRVATEGDGSQLEEVAQLAERCLRLTGEERPSMKEVAEELERLRRFERHPWAQPSSDEGSGRLLGRTGYQSDMDSVDNISMPID
ncbi:hypothetical protein GW17_00016498 [Ensete ventricosum]|nr:hypothetical protein GW17_00016498 [Ensete ventricosum]